MRAIFIICRHCHARVLQEKLCCVLYFPKGYSTEVALFALKRDLSKPGTGIIPKKIDR